MRVSGNRYHILWILILAGALRMIQIDSPPVGRHAWRQCDTAGVARNFLHSGHRLLYPQIDWEVPGYVEMEFPVYPWVTSLLYSQTGESAAVARALALLGALATIAFLYLLLDRILGHPAALWAAWLVAISPASLFFGRAIMPEAWMLAASVAALYFALRWLEDGSSLSYGLAILATALACLLKLTSLYLGLPLLWLVWQRWGRRTPLQWPVWIFAGTVTAALVLWYGHAFRLGQEFGASFHILTAAGADKWGTWRLLIDPAFYNRVFVGYLGERMLTWVGLPLFSIGLLLPRQSRRERLVDVWLLAVVIVLLVASGGSYQHDYYSLPLLLPAAAYVGKVFARGWPRRRPWLVTAAILIVVLAAYRHRGALADERRSSLSGAMAQAVAADSRSGDLVISCNSANPTWLYLAGRRGFGRDCARLDKPGLHELIERGARFLVSRGSHGAAPAPKPRLANYLRTYFEILRDEDDLFLVDLTSPLRSDELSWRTVWSEDFSQPDALRGWSLEGGSWEVRSGALYGSRQRQTAGARSLEALPICRVCRVSISLTLEPPDEADPEVETDAKARGAGRADAQTAIDLWWREEGTGVSVTLSTRTGKVGLHQSRNGRRIDSIRAELEIAEAQPIELEVYSDGFEIELWVDGRQGLTAVQQVPRPLTGQLAVRPRLGSVRLERITIEAPRRRTAASDRR